MKLFDNHSHLNDEKFDEDRDEIIREIINTDTKNFITAGYSLEGSKKAVEISNKYDFMYATCGISPNDIPQNEEELWTMLDEIKELVKTSSKNVAIGEIGLDYYWNKENKDLQKKAFIEQIKLANELNLPIVIHTREAVMDTIEILKKHEVKNKGVFPCRSRTGGFPEVRLCLIQAGRNDTPAFISAQPWSLICMMNLTESSWKLCTASRRILS